MRPQAGVNQICLVPIRVCGLLLLSQTSWWVVFFTVIAADTSVSAAKRSPLTQDRQLVSNETVTCELTVPEATVAVDGEFDLHIMLTNNSPNDIEIFNITGNKQLVSPYQIWLTSDSSVADRDLALYRMQSLSRICLPSKKDWSLLKGNSSRSIIMRMSLRYPAALNRSGLWLSEHNTSSGQYKIHAVCTGMLRWQPPWRLHAELMDDDHKQHWRLLVSDKSQRRLLKKVEAVSNACKLNVIE